MKDPCRNAGVFNNHYMQYFILIIPLILAFLDFTFEARNKNKKGFFNQITFWGWIFVALTLFLCIAIALENKEDNDYKNRMERLSKKADSLGELNQRLIVKNDSTLIKNHEVDQARADNIHKTDSINSSYRHKYDSINYSNRTYTLEDTIRSSREKMIKEVNKIKLSNVEPFIDLDYDVTPNPYADYKNDTIWFKISLTNTTEAAAINIEYLSVFINPLNDSIYPASVYYSNGNVSLSKGTTVTIPFWASGINKMPNTFYIYFIAIYSNIDRKLHPPIERVFLRNKNNLGYKCVDADINSFVRYGKLARAKLHIPEYKTTPTPSSR
jgi:hypothetical protein